MRSAEVKATTVDAEGMIKEGREIAAIHPNMVVKIPMTVEGLKAVKVLSAEGIKTNVTLIFTANQALLAARAGAFTSPLIGPSTMDVISLITSLKSLPSFAIRDGFVVTPQITPISFALRRSVISNVTYRLGNCFIVKHWKSMCIF